MNTILSAILGILLSAGVLSATHPVNHGFFVSTVARSPKVAGENHGKVVSAVAETETTVTPSPSPTPTPTPTVSLSPKSTSDNDMDDVEIDREGD